MKNTWKNKNALTVKESKRKKQILLIKASARVLFLYLLQKSEVKENNSKQDLTCKNHI